MRDSELWEKIQSFEMNVKGDVFPFTERLARDNNWSRDYALRVIEEYKKFIYLVMVSPHHVTPSDQVDQVWHLHLVYTQSYWVDLCDRVLGRKIHHNPTKGGDEQKKSFKSYYAETKITYEKEFGVRSPVDIWPDEKIRFGETPYYKRINLSRYWLIPRVDFGTTFAIVLIGLLITGCVSNDNLFKPWGEYTDNGKLVILMIGGFIIFRIYVSFVKFLRRRGILRPRKSRRNNSAGHTGCGGCFFDGGGDSGCSGCGGCGD